jgi:hypothetical protein
LSQRRFIFNAVPGTFAHAGAESEVEALMTEMRRASLVRRGRIRALRLAARLTVGGYAAFAGLNAQAADLSSIAPAFGNTVVSSYPDGTSQKIWLHPDGSWDGISRKNQRLAGKWTLRDDKVCLRQTRPPSLPISYCTAVPAAGTPGVQWAGRDVVGRPITLSLVRGVPPGYQDGEASTH